MKVLFATAEVSPVAKTGGLGDVCGALPKYLARMGHEVAVFMPLYRQAREWLERNGGGQTIGRAQIAWADWAVEATYVRTNLPGSEVPLILVANDFFFNREHLYSPRLNGYDDGIERYTFFNRAVIRGCEVFGFAPEIVHAHDWHTALLPVYLHSGLRGSDQFRNARSVYTIHNLNYQGMGAPDSFRHLGLHSRYWAPDALEHFGALNFMKGGIIFADQVSTVSPNYAREIQTAAFGAGLDGILRALSYKFRGILNGIDADEWNPATDELLDAHFELGKLHGKSVQKRMLQKEAGFQPAPKTPLIGVVSRLVDQKGFHLLIPILERLLAAGAEVVLLGSGDTSVENAFRAIGEQHPDRCRVWIGFDNALAHRIYGGCDLLLMPSLYEPCGLNQMYALRYGTLPVVRLTGGLADTVIPFDGTNAAVANGFGFVAPSPADLYFATWIGMLNYKDSKVWKTLQTNGMQTDFSWERSAREYVTMYEQAHA